MIDPIPVPADPAFAAAFWAHVGPIDPNGCRLWTSTHTHDGYALFTWPGNHGQRVKYRANRVALILTRGPAPTGAPWALHTCHIRDCCQPHHLYWGSPAQNSADRDSPQRQAQLRAQRDHTTGQLRLL